LSRWPYVPTLYTETETEFDNGQNDERKSLMQEEYLRSYVATMLLRRK